MQGKFPKTRIHSGGYVLVEAIIAITIAVVGLLGIFSLLSRSLSLNRVVADRFVAAYLAAEGIEIVKNMIDNNILAGRPWNDGLSSGSYEADYADVALRPDSGNLLNFDAETGAYGYRESSPTTMRRSLVIEVSPDGERIAVGSAIDWTTRGGGRFSLELEEQLFNWR